MTFSASTLPKQPEFKTHTWTWRGFAIAYQVHGMTGPAVLMVHGFGASCGHWRKNLPVLGKICRCYAIDLIGFGASAKPTPGLGVEYTFETWGQQVIDFCREVIKTPVFLIGNSIGCIVVMQAAVESPTHVLGVTLINCSLRMLHERKRVTLPLFRRIGAPLVQRLLGIRWIGRLFFHQLAKPNVIRKILLQAYRNPESVTDELIEILMKPAADLGAADVFLAFTRYSAGPLPEDLLPQLSCPTLILWGTDDPWEPIHEAKAWSSFPCVEKFIALEGVGHCPQDEAPDQVNPLLQDWIEQHSVEN